MTLATVPAARMLRMRSANVGSSCEGSTRLKKSALGVDAGHDGLGGDFFAVGEDDGVDGAVFDANVAARRASVRISTPAGERRRLAHA